MANQQDVKHLSTVLPQSLCTDATTPLAQLGLNLEAIKRIQRILSSSSSSSGKPVFSPDDEKILFLAFTSAVPRNSTKTEVKCLTRLAGNLSPTITAAGNIITLNLVSIGTAKNQRLGAGIRLVRVTGALSGVGRSTSQAFASTEGSSYRLQVVYDRIPIVSSDFAEVIATGAVTAGYLAPNVASGDDGLIDAQPHPINRHARYEVIHDKRMTPNTQIIQVSVTNSQASCVFAHYFDEDLHGRPTTWYDPATSTSILTGEVGFWFCQDSTQAAALPTIYHYISNIYYVDV